MIENPHSLIIFELLLEVFRKRKHLIQKVIIFSKNIFSILIMGTAVPQKATGQ